MRLIVAAFALLVSWSATAQELTIATFNAEFLTRPKVHVRFGLPINISGADAATWNQPGFRDQKFAESAALVASVLAPIDADVLALTEVGNETDLTELRDAINDLGVNYPHLAVCACTDTFTRQHVGILSKFPLTDVLTVIPDHEGYYQELDDPDSEKDTGLSKGMRATFSAHDETFHLYVLHLASERGGHEQDQQRIAQASIIRRHYLPLINAGDHIIVAGDLNDYRGQPALRRIRGFDDIWPDLIQTGRYEFFEKDEQHTRWTYMFRGARKQIDHVPLSESIDDVGKIRARVVEDGTSGASDHRPLVVTVQFSAR